MRLVSLPGMCEVPVLRFTFPGRGRERRGGSRRSWRKEREEQRQGRIKEEREMVRGVGDRRE